MKQSLNFSWSFIKGFKDAYLTKLDKLEASEVNIPHNPVEIPYNYFSEKSYQGIFTYEKLFDVDNYNENRVYILHFEGFMFLADIYLNGEKLGQFYSGYLPVDIDITKYVKKSNNRLVMVIDSRENKDYPPFGFAIDYLSFSGIYREVWLESHLPTYLNNFYIHGDLNGNIDVIYDVNGKDEISVEKVVFDENNQEKARFSGNSYKLEDFKLWDLDNPTLYKLRTIVTLNGETEVYENRFAFRETRFTNQGFFLNGKKVKLVGLNRHQGYPYMGYAASKSLQEDDALILKNELGVNVVRTSHYSQSEHFLNKCDELGLLVVNEIPGWQHIGQSETWRKECVENARRMVLKERNHPCIIAHGVRIDESVDDHELYEKTNEIAHKLDKYRQTIGVRNFKNSELLEDIYGYNDFVCDSLNIGLSKPKTIKTQNHPLLITEYMGHMDPVKENSDEGKRVEVALRHAKVIDDNFKYENTAGAIGWCFVDYHSHTDFGSGDHICPHGVLDLYRNKKYTAAIYASQQDKNPVLEVLSNMKPGDVPEAIFNDIYIATNCDYVEVYKSDEFVKRLQPKNDKFKYLKHPPILLDDIVGETFKEEKFPKKSYPKIARTFSYAAMHGFNHLPLSTKIYLGWMMFRYKVSFTDLVGYWNKYVGSWGGMAKTYKFVGFKDGNKVKEVELGPSNEFDLEVIPNKTELANEDTYDTLKITLRHVDSHKSLMQYSQRIVEVETDGPIQLVGPKQQTLLGGQLTLYINSLNKAGNAKVTIKMDDIEKSIDIKVK
ncbi:MAG: glycoside hydrolase family 2 protein [Bacilli bacterium]|nr:glycoside hydrolase family 2 protein [Bacilli bacterium]